MMNATSSRSHSIFMITVEQCGLGTDGAGHIRVRFFWSPNRAGGHVFFFSFHILVADITYFNQAKMNLYTLALHIFVTHFFQPGGQAEHGGPGGL